MPIIIEAILISKSKAGSNDKVAAAIGAVHPTAPVTAVSRW